MGFEPGIFVRPPLRFAWIGLRARIGLCRCPAGSPASSIRAVEVRAWECLDGWVGRSAWMCIAISVRWRFVWAVRFARLVGAGHAGGRELAGGESGGLGSGGVGGDGQLLGGREDPRAAREPRGGLS